MGGERAELKPGEIAAMLGLTTGRVYQLIKNGTLPAVRRGRAVRIPRSAFDLWLEEQCALAISSAHRLRETEVSRDDY